MKKWENCIASSRKNWNASIDLVWEPCWVTPRFITSHWAVNKTKIYHIAITDKFSLSENHFYFMHSSHSLSHFTFLQKNNKTKQKLKSSPKDAIFKSNALTRSVTDRHPWKDVNRHRIKPFRQKNRYDPRRRCGDIHDGDPGRRNDTDFSFLCDELFSAFESFVLENLFPSVFFR